MTPTPDDLSARLKRVALDCHEGLLNYREACEEIDAALSALPAAGGEPVAVVIPNVVGVEIAWIDPPSAGRPPVGTKLYTTPQPSAAEPNKTCGVCGSHRIRKHPKGTECMDCRTIHHHHAAVGTQGGGYPNTSDVPDSELREQLSACRDDWQRLCDAVEPGQHFDPDDLIRHLAAPSKVEPCGPPDAAGKGVDDAMADLVWLGTLLVREREAVGGVFTPDWQLFRAALEAALTRKPVAGDGNGN